jgi:S-DNA-T family DNA segregation ATPase FtsK/SpoIIIE
VTGSPSRSIDAFRAAAGEQADVVDITGVQRADSGRLDVSALDRATVFIGDTEAWQTHWSLLVALRADAEIVFDGGTLADYRTISRRRDLPPPLASGHGWVLGTDGHVSRIVLPRIVLPRVG